MVLVPIRYHFSFRIQGKPVATAACSLRWQSIRKFGVTTAAVAAIALGHGALLAKGPAPAHPTDTAVVALTDLPQQAQDTHRLILAGGPFPFDKDGSVFFNRERLLPAKPRGHYREYTVRTPGVRHRGARRIVCGGQPPTKPEVCYYTDDHYASFRRIIE